MNEIDIVENVQTREKLLAPLLETARERCRSIRSCVGLTDENFLLLGCLRVVMGRSSGREHIQDASEGMDLHTDVSKFFKALRSPRRARMVKECSEQLYELASSRLAGVDMLAPFPDLRGLRVFAVDGHRIEEACHAKQGGKKATVNTLYELELGNGLCRPLAVAASAQGEAHEMKAFRDSRGEALAGRSLEIVDRAYVDIRWWDRQAQKGAMMLMRAKKDMSPRFRGELDWDKELAINQGVLSDREAGFNCGKRLRWIEFADPENGERFTFVTTCWSLPPGLLCMLYLMRWRVEKIYDSFKNKLSQTKAWATTEHSRSMQAHFICMAHNLMAVFLAELGRDHGIREEKVLEKRRRWLEKREEQARESGRSMHIFHRLIDSGSQVTVQFVRSLRNAIIHKKLFLDSLPAFRKSMESYLN